MSLPLRIVLVRHGESTWNADGRWQGQADPPLTDRGRDQARLAAASLPDVDLVASSDLHRASETARLLSGPTRPITVDLDLRERNAGAFSGLRRAEIHQRHPGLLPDDPVRDPETHNEGLIPPPGWEPDAVLVARAWVALDRLAAALTAAGATTGVAVTHSGLIYGVEADLGAPRERIPNLGARWLNRNGEAWSLGPREELLAPDVATTTAADQL